jgi:hypothetical protein
MRIAKGNSCGTCDAVVPIDIEPVPDQVGETPSLKTEALLPVRPVKPFQDSLRIATSNRFVDLFKRNNSYFGKTNSTKRQRL